MKLYTVVEAIPSRLLGLAGLLQTTHGMGFTRSEIVDLLQPVSLRKGTDADPNMSNKVIDAARELELVEEYDNERGESCLRLASGVSAPEKGTATEHWAHWIALRVLSELTGSVARNLATVMAWFMTLRPRDTPTDRVGWKSRFERDGYSLDEFGLNNDARWDNLFDWSRFLGLTWQTRTGRDSPGVVVSPATLLSRFLADLLPEGQEVGAADFRIRLGALFPSLDGGSVFLDVRERVALARGESLDLSDRWSPGVGMALRELRDRGSISYHCPDDQRTFLLFDDGERMAFVSRGQGDKR